MFVYQRVIIFICENYRFSDLLWHSECCVGNTEPSYRPMSFPEPTLVNVDTTCILWSHGHIYIYINTYVCVCCNCPLPKVGAIFVQQGGEVFGFWSFCPWTVFAHCGQFTVDVFAHWFGLSLCWGVNFMSHLLTGNTGKRTCSAEKSDGLEGAHNLIKKYTKLCLRGHLASVGAKDTSCSWRKSEGHSMRQLIHDQAGPAPLGPCSDLDLAPTWQDWPAPPWKVPCIITVLSFTKGQSLPNYCTEESLDKMLFLVDWIVRHQEKCSSFWPQGFFRVNKWIV